MKVNWKEVGLVVALAVSLTLLGFFIGKGMYNKPVDQLQTTAIDSLVQRLTHNIDSIARYQDTLLINIKMKNDENIRLYNILNNYVVIEDNDSLIGSVLYLTTNSGE